MPKRIYARTKRVYQSSPKNLFYDNNLMFRPSILTPTILRAMAELRSKHNKVTDLFNKRFPSMVSSIGSNRSSINTLFLQNRVIGVESLDFLRGWFHKCAVKMPGYPVNVDRNEVPRFDDVISLAMGATQFGVDTISDDQEPCPKLTLQDLQLLILHDFNIGTAMRQINQIRSSESRYQLRYLSDAELDLADKTLHVHARFQSVAHLICWWRYVCRAIPHVLFCGNTEHMRDNTFMAFLAANINERPTALWLESQARITTVNRTSMKLTPRDPSVFVPLTLVGKFKLPQQQENFLVVDKHNMTVVNPQSWKIQAAINEKFKTSPPLLPFDESDDSPLDESFEEYKPLTCVQFFWRSHW